MCSERLAEKTSLSCRQKIVRIEADWRSSSRLQQSRGPAAGNERSQTMTSHEGRASRSLEVDN